MSAANKLKLVSVEDYLANELDLPVKHEYFGGYVYAMAGARNQHNLIATNTVTALGYRLRGKRCKVFNSDTKIRIQLPGHMRFYYPDGSVTCRPNSPDESFQDAPVVIVEVLSDSTRRIDEGEKKDAYLTIPSLRLYLLVEQEFPAIVAYRRTASGFVREVHQGLDAVIPMSEIDIELPLAEVYDGVTFGPESKEAE